MTTTVDPKEQRKRLARKLKSIEDSRVFKFLIRVLDPVPESLMDGVWLLIFTGIVGGVLSVLGPYVLHAPELIGGVAASWCVEKGNCDLTTNVMSIAMGLYLLAAIGLNLMRPLFVPSKQSRQSIYYDVLDELKGAGERGIAPKDIAKRSGHDVVDVHTMLGFLFSDGEIELVNHKYAGQFTMYRIAHYE